MENDIPPIALHSKLLTSQRHCLAAINLSCCVSCSFRVSYDQLWSRYHQWRFEVQSEFVVPVDAGWSRRVGLLFLSWDDTNHRTVQEEVQASRLTECMAIKVAYINKLTFFFY